MKEEKREPFSTSLKEGNKDKIKLISVVEKKTIGEILDEEIEERYEKAIKKGE